MAIIFANPNGEMRGSVGANTYTRSASGKQVMRSRVKPTNPRTIAQSTARTLFASGSTAYTQLSTAIKSKWDAIANAKGIKQGRWDYVRRYKWIKTSNQTKATAGTNVLPATQPDIDTGILNTPNSVVPNVTITSGTASGVALLFDNFALSVTNMALTFRMSLADSTKNFVGLQNAASAYLGLVFEIEVKKGQSKYRQVLLSFTKLTGWTAAATYTITAAYNSIPRTNYKYNPLVGDTVKIYTYMIDPGANYERVLVTENTVTAVA